MIYKDRYYINITNFNNIKSIHPSSLFMAQRRLVRPLNLDIIGVALQEEPQYAPPDTSREESRATKNHQGRSDGTLELS